MRSRMLFMVLIAGASITVRPTFVAAQPADAGVPISALAADVRQSANERDSLAALVDTTKGETRDILEELIAQREAELHAGVMALVRRIKEEQARGRDVAEAKRLLGEA